MKFYTLYVQYALYHKTGSLQVKEPVTSHRFFHCANRFLRLALKKYQTKNITELRLNFFKKWPTI